MAISDFPVREGLCVAIFSKRVGYYFFRFYSVFRINILFLYLILK